METREFKIVLKFLFMLVMKSNVATRSQFRGILLVTSKKELIYRFSVHFHANRYSRRNRVVKK